MKVLVIPEDQTLDTYIVQPIVEALLRDAGIPGRADVLPEPRLRGADDALDKELLNRIVTDNPMIDVFVLVVDRDCDRQHNERRAREREAEHRGKLIACVAKEEVEVWMLALHKDAIAAPWQQIRDECDPKEMFAEPLLRDLGSSGPGRGRKRAMKALSGRIRSLLTLCPELASLQRQLQQARDARA